MNHQLRDDWVKLFAVSDYVPPKFWLGDRVVAHDKKATILGIEWRPRMGWWYRLMFDDVRSGRAVYALHESLLEVDSNEAH